MASTLNSPRFLLQCDWEFSIRNKSETFWSGLKIPGKSTVYFDFLAGSCSGAGGGETANVESSNQNFGAVYKQKNRSLRIHDLSNSCGTTFYAPSSVDGSLHKKNIYSLDVSPGGLGVSSDSTGSLFVWETESYSLRRPLRGHVGDIYACRFFPSGLVVLSGGADMQLKIWSVENGVCARTLIGHQKAITDIGFIDRGRNVISCSRDGTCRLWDCGSGSCLFQFQSNDAVQINALAVGAKFAFSSNSSQQNESENGTENKLLTIACENGALSCFSMGDKSKLFEVQCNGALNSCVFLNENTVICGSDKGIVNAIDLRKSNSFLFQICEDRGAICNFCAAGKGYWISHSDGSVNYRDIESSRNGSFTEMELSGPDCDPVSRLRTDGRYLYTCCRDAKIRKYAVA